MKYQNQLSPINIKKDKQLVFISKIIICFIMLFFIEILTIRSTFPGCIIFQFMLGALYAHMIELQHEALHGATQWKLVNRFIGFFLGLPMLISYTDYQYHHMLHHKHIGTDKDTEYFNYSDKKTFSFYRFILSLFMFEHYISVFKKITKTILLNKVEIKQKHIRRKIKQEYFLYIIIFSTLILLSIVYKSLLILKLWVIPLFLFANPIHFLIELPEHVFCENNNTDIFRNTRTIKSNWLISWFVNGNNYHIEHHYAPHYPISSLSDLHNKIKTNIIHFEKSYTNFYWSLFKRIITSDRN